MANLASVPMSGDTLVPAAAVSLSAVPNRHSAFVRVTHWITALCFVALLVFIGARTGTY